MTVLVAAASKHGATDEIAERIGADLAERGLDVDVKKLEEVGDLGGFMCAATAGTNRMTRTRRCRRGSPAGTRSSARSWGHR